MTEKESSATGSETPSVDIHYIKTPDFREIACDGALGGPTPHGKLWLAFYSERFPLPRVVRQNLTPVGDSGEFTLDDSVPATVVESRRGLVRSVEFGVYMSVETATQLNGWLNKFLSETENPGEE